MAYNLELSCDVRPCGGAIVMHVEVAEQTYADAKFFRSMKHAEPWVRSLADRHSFSLNEKVTLQD